MADPFLARRSQMPVDVLRLASSQVSQAFWPGKSSMACGGSAGRCPTGLLGNRQARLLPRFPSTVERNGVGIAHLLQVVGGQCGAVTTAAVEHQARLLVRCLRFDIAL